MEKVSGIAQKHYVVLNPSNFSIHYNKTMYSLVTFWIKKAHYFATWNNKIFKMKI